MSGSRGDITPRSAVVVGAGIVGLSTAWFLQDRGVHVTVVDRDEVGAGASWGNAGYLSPALAMPLTSPHVLGEGLRGLADRRAPLSIPARWDPRLWGFLLRFAAHCRAGYWRRALQYHLPLLEECLPAFDTLASDGVDAGGQDAPVVAGLETARAAGEMVRELTLLRRLGVPVELEQLDRGDVVALRPQLSERVVAGVSIDGQRFLDPGRFLDRLAQALVRRGATIRRRFAVTRIVSDLDRVSAYPDEGPPVTAEVAVVATGARLDDLVRPRGVRVRVRAGRGYSFSVPTDIPVAGPIYLPGVRVACTPLPGSAPGRGHDGVPGPRPTDGHPEDRCHRRLRPAPVDRRRVGRAQHPLGRGPTGHRGCAPDHRRHPQRGVFVAGGHGMWGVTFGPVTGRLLAEQITTGKQPTELVPFDPLR